VPPKQAKKNVKTKKPVFWPFCNKFLTGEFEGKISKQKHHPNIHHAMRLNVLFLFIIIVYFSKHSM